MLTRTNSGKHHGLPRPQTVNYHLACGRGTCARRTTESHNVTKTLHRYLGIELARVTGLALVAFTLVLTVFAIIEPLRKEGLSGSQAMVLFVFTVPILLSLTLPIAALFAASIVYGRFSQDNELLASRASGISTLTLLRPAVVKVAKKPQKDSS